MRDELAQPNPGTAAPTKPRLWLHILLFGATFATTTAFGLLMAVEVPAEDLPEDSSMATLSELLLSALTPRGIGLALAYSVPILAILLAHELGHYLVARSYGVQASLPYFLPGLPPFGTFGAFIRMRIQRIDASKLFRIGVGGPYAGFVVALPLLVLGLHFSEVQEIPADLTDGRLGDSLLILGLTKVMFGTLPDGHDVMLHPMAYAGWVGMFVTSFNLVPIGQLDGGHVAYTLFGERFNKVSGWLLVGLVVLGVTVFAGWLVLVLFLLFLGPKHPVVLEGDSTIHGMERVAGYGALVLFLLTFVPCPFVVPTIWDAVRDYLVG